ncbi:hypothetical protein FB45DRAFT_108475 [Roridomyces roridus]|uniref:F-box domain-containing protein n=1 Tax=Roridomyces roridus TaxID=1738132 RepID=A0AAD7FGV6_9AGAR|nr:hypothetical protein FB45DRAFT_108475 [Roridomyces roridus]
MATTCHPDSHTIGPIASAPIEILQHIFKSCLPDAHAPHDKPFSSTEAPLLLCRVCALWRTIAIATPQLWARLAISVGENNNLRPSRPLIATWVTRSASQPLSLVVHSSDQCASAAETVDEVLQIFLPHIRRWRSITFILPCHPVPRSLALVPDGDFLLQIAKFEFWVTTAQRPQISGLAKLLKSSPQLHTLYWGNDLEWLDIDWTRLTVLDLVPVWRPMYQVTQIMQNAPKLRSLSVYINHAGSADVGRIVLPDLAILWIWSEVDMNPLFRRLSVPALANINVFADFAPFIPQVEVVHCLARCRSKLDVAIFQSLHIPEPDLIALLRTQPALRLLELRALTGNGMTGQLLTLLTLREASPDQNLCPDLRIIRLLQSSFSSTDGLLADMVASRRMGVEKASLSSLVVHFSDADLPQHTEDIRRLRDLANEVAFRVWIHEPETKSG